MDFYCDNCEYTYTFSMWDGITDLYCPCGNKLRYIGDNKKIKKGLRKDEVKDDKENNKGHSQGGESS